ncbi:MAG: fasciclin domain-containing protein [Candidatus Krumholzibacteriota bacterium]|nr:fasciclin domain-containing protein [Candidatus Krumholzibacteriota bacterium]
MKRYLLIAMGLVFAVTFISCSETSTSPEDYSSLKELDSMDESVEITGRMNEGAMKRQMNGMKGKALPPGGMTIAEIAEDAGFTLLLAAVGYIAEMNPDSPLIAGLLNNDQYTVFAPTDDAFLNLVAAVEDLLDPDILAEEGPFAAIDDLLGAGTIEAVVSYHVTEGRRASNSVVPRRHDRTIMTLLEGATFSVSTDAMITAVGNTAYIVTPNISASNGIIHVIDAVILPVDLGL